nr:hypothetical protein [Tanacetum cinerariifolium]
MADLAFAPQHNMIAYLEKAKSNVEFHQIVDFLTSSSIHHSLTIHAIVDGGGDSLVRAATTASLDAQHDNSNITKTQSKVTLSEPTSQREGSGSGLGRQETMGGAMAHIRSEGALIQSIDPPLSIGYTIGSDEGSMTLKELIDFCTTLLQKVLDLENVKSVHAKEIASFKKKVTKLEQRQSSRFSDMIVEDKGNGEKGGSTAETVSTARLDISAVRPEVSTIEPKTPPTTTTLFDEKMSPLLIPWFTHAQLKSRSFEEIQKLYIKEQKWVYAFVPIGSKEDKKRIGSRKKRAAENRKCVKVVPYDDKAIDYETLDVKSLIVDYESQVLGTNETSDIHVYKLTRLDGSYRHFSTFSRMLEVLDRKDVLDLHKIIMERFSANDLEEKRYPLTKEILKKMLSLRLEAENESTLPLDLIKFIKLQIEEK